LFILDAEIEGVPMVVKFSNQGGKTNLGRRRLTIRKNNNFRKNTQ